jgi:ketosteroid isomerase-like protein
MSVEANKGIVLGLFENLSSGNAEAVLGALADTATWWVQGNFALSGTKSKKEFAELIGGLGSKIDGGLRVTPKGITAEGERVAVEAESLRQDEDREDLSEHLPLPLHGARRKDPVGQGIPRYDSRE